MRDDSHKPNWLLLGLIFLSVGIHLLLLRQMTPLYRSGKNQQNRIDPGTNIQPSSARDSETQACFETFHKASRTGPDRGAS